MATLYTDGNYITLTPAQFNSYSLIRYSADQPWSSVQLGLTVSGTVNFAAKLGSVSALVDGFTGNDYITTGGGNDTIWGNRGNDKLAGVAGDDVLIGDWDTTDRIGNDILYGGDGNDELIGGYGNDNLQGGDGNDLFSYGELLAGNDSLFGGAGTDAVSVRNIFGSGLREVSFNNLVLTTAASVEFFAWDDDTIALRGTNGNDLINLSGTKALTWNGASYAEQISFDLGTGDDSFVGGTSAETLLINGSKDKVSLEAGDDRLILVGGGLASGTFAGGSGNDTLLLRGSDTSELVVTIGSLNLTSAAGFEVLVFEHAALQGTAGADKYNLSAITEIIGQGETSIGLADGNDSYIGSVGNDRADGQQGRDTLFGGLGDDWLNGGAGADSLSGGQGDDVYLVDDAGDVIVELADEGYDRIQTTLATYTLGETFEWLIAQGKGSFSGTGNALYNRLEGGDGADHLLGLGGQDTLIGGAGVDTLEGGLGADTYFVTTRDVIIEGADSALDTVYAETGVYKLTANLEVLRAWFNLALDGTGNLLNNAIYGSGFGDTLTGLGGNDTLNGSSGQDGLFGGTGRDLIDGGEDGDTLLGGYGNDSLYGGDGNDLVDGSANTDQLYGGVGDDTLLGGAGNDSLLGGGGNDRLDGNAGDDQLVGGDGNDLYVVDDQSDLIVEGQSGGVDTVLSSVRRLHLRANVENIEADASLSEVRFYGTSGANILKGSSGNDRLFGGEGADKLYSSSGRDTLSGGNGEDVYYIDAAAGVTKLVESSVNPREVDKVFSAAALTVLTSYVEELHITSTTGATARADSTTYSWLYGGIGNDVLQFGSFMDGGLGADTMVGSAAGGSAFVVDDAGDVLKLKAGGAADTVYLNTDYYQMDLLLENLQVMGNRNAHVIGAESGNSMTGGDGNETLAGMGGDDTLTGGKGDDLLQGGDGNDLINNGSDHDTLVGGAGDDVYRNFSRRCVAVEEAGGGFDTIYMSIDITSFRLPPGFEALIFNGYGEPCTGTGNALDNLISARSTRLLAYGLGGNDTLEGSYNSSTLYGGLGDDQYILNGATYHNVIELDGEGFDTLFVSGTFSLPENVEGLTMMEGAVGSVYGNAQDNIIIGNSGKNYLMGHSGNDTLTGGAGEDQFSFDGLGWVDHVTDFESGGLERIFLWRSFGVFKRDGNSPYPHIDETQFKDLSTGAADKSDRILYDRATGNLFYDADGLGGVDAILFAVIDNKAQLSATDIWVS